MAKAKGTPKTGGRQKGVENKVTRDTKEAFKRLVESNHDNMTLWLSRVAIEDPAKALEIVTKLAEYFIPKLARQVDENGKDAKITFLIKTE